MAELVLDQIQGPEAERQFAELEDQVFPVSPGGHYLDDFPIWDSAYEPGPGIVFRAGAFEGTKLAAAAGVRLASLHYPRGSITVALVGAVATAEAYRGKGLATRLTSLAVEWAAQRGALLAMLWGSEHQLYGRIGFSPCGTQATIPLSTMLSSTETSPRKILRGWTPGILKLLRSRRSGLELRDSDRAWIAAHKNVQWFWTGSAEQVTAYAALGRGIDLAHFVHEWGGDRSALHAVFNEIKKFDPGAKLLGSPELFRKYGFQHDPSTEESLGLARVIDAMSLFREVHPEVPFHAGFEQGKWKLATVDSRGESISAVFSPQELSRLYFGPLPQGVKAPWSQLFPIPLWFWGLDAV